MNFDFGDVLARAWRITWNNKILWLFGILSALGGSGSEGAQLRFGNDFDFSPGPGVPPQLPPPVERFFERLQEGDPVVVGVILGLVCVGIIIAVIFFVLSIIGRGGLIGGVQLANASGHVTFGEAWAMGQRNFWRLFVIGLLIGLITLGAALFLALPGTICFPLICVFVVVAILLSIIAYFAQIAAVTEDLSATSALGRAWQIIQANVAPIIVLGIILGGISLVIGFISFLPLLAIVVPAALAVAGFANENQNVGTASIIIASLCFLAYLPVMILIGGTLQTWVTSAWTLAYQQFTRPAAAPSVGPAPTIAPS